MRRIGLLVVAFALVFAGAGQGPLAQPGAGRAMRGPGPGVHLEWMLDRLDLEPSQSEEVLGIVERYHEGPLGDIAGELHQARRQLMKAIHDTDAEDQQIIDAARVVSARSEQMALERHRMFVEIGRVLTPDQQAALLEMIENDEGPGPGPHRRHRPGGGW